MAVQRPQEEAGFVRSSAPFEPSAPAEDIAAVVAADTAFSLDILDRTWLGDNLIVSPS